MTEDPMKQMRTIDSFIKYLIERDYAPKTVIDVGACYGTPELFRNLPEAYHIYFEPIPWMEDRLKLLSNKFPGEYHMLALSAEPGQLMLRYPQGRPEAGTLTAQVEPVSEGVIQQAVPVETLDRVVAGRHLARPALLKTDCQGFDLDVIRGGNRTMQQIDIVISEVNLFFAAGDTNRPVLSDFVTYLASIGFEVFDILSYNQRPLDRALGYVDLALVRRDGDLWQNHRWA